MDITTLAAYGEFIGGIAVVVSLIYLAEGISSCVFRTADTRQYGNQAPDGGLLPFRGLLSALAIFVAFVFDVFLSPALLTLIYRSQERS
jgi:hypothetical protein